MRLDVRAVEQEVRGRPSDPREGLENLCPDPRRRPADEAVVEGLVGAVVRRRIHPTTAGPKNMHDAADHPAIIDAGYAARLVWKQRLKTGELGFGEPEVVVRHVKLPISGCLNHIANLLGIPLYGSGP